MAKAPQSDRARARRAANAHYAATALCATHGTKVGASVLYYRCGCPTAQNAR